MSSEESQGLGTARANEKIGHQVAGAAVRGCSELSGGGDAISVEKLSINSIQKANHFLLCFFFFFSHKEGSAAAGS